MIGCGAATGIERRDSVLARRRPRQTAEVVEHERERVVEGRRITNTALPEHADDHERCNRLRRMHQVFESGVATGGLPGAEQRLQVPWFSLAHPPLYGTGSLLHDITSPEHRGAGPMHSFADRAPPRPRV